MQTQEVIRACIRPGMLIKHGGKTYTASAQKKGKLYLFRAMEVIRISDVFIQVCIDSRGEPLFK